MNILSTFWSWMTQSVSSALNTLNTLYNNTILHDFFNIFLAVFGTMVIIKYIILPLVGGMGSDKVKKEKKEKE